MIVEVVTDTGEGLEFPNVPARAADRFLTELTARPEGWVQLGSTWLNREKIVTATVREDE